MIEGQLPSQLPLQVYRADDHTNKTHHLGRSEDGDVR